MEYLVQEAATAREAIELLKAQYGEDLVIYSTRSFSRRRLFKSRSVVEVTAYRRVRDQEPEDQNKDMQRHRQEVFERLLAILYENDFDPVVAAGYIERLRTQCDQGQEADLNHLTQRLLTMIAETIEAHLLPMHSFPKRVCLLGPTGVGKTTTIAKLAAKARQERSSLRSVALVSIDSYRIGAKAQISTFASIMDMPVRQARTARELLVALDELSESDTVLIDTIGRSPKDIEIHEQMRKILSVCVHSRPTQFILAFSASTKYRDILLINERFSSFPISSVIVTKLDETETVGSLISAMESSDLQLSFVATGQRVPQDLLPMNSSLLLRRLRGFGTDLENLMIGQTEQTEGVSIGERAFLNGEVP